MESHLKVLSMLSQKASISMFVKPFNAGGSCMSYIFELDNRKYVLARMWSIIWMIFLIVLLLLPVDVMSSLKLQF